MDSPLSYLDVIRSKRQAAEQQSTRRAEIERSLDTTKKSSDSLAAELVRQHAKDRLQRQETRTVRVAQDIPEKSDIKSILSALGDIDTSVKGSEQAIAGLLKDLATAIAEINKSQPVHAKQEKVNFDSLATIVKTSQQEQAAQVTSALKEVVEAVRQLDVSPQIEVAAPVVNVPERKTEVHVDLKPLLSAVETLKTAIDNKKLSVPKTDLSALEAAMQGVKAAIDNQVFPVPNYVLPFKDTTGAAVQLVLNGGGIPTAQPSTPVTTSVNDTTSATTLIAANSNRLEVEFLNTSSSILYLLKGTGTPSATNHTVALNQGDYYSSTIKSAFKGVWSADSTGAVLITEST